MWILPHSPFFPSAPEVEDSTSVSSWRSDLLASSASLNGTHSPSASWSRRWKRAPWLRLLYGRISEPSTVARGVERWIASLPVTPVNRFHRLEAVAARTILATCGPKFTEWCRRYVPPSSFWRTSQGTLDLGLEESCEISEMQATELRRLSSGLRMWAHRTNGRGCSSSESWATPEAMVMDGTSRRKPDRSPNTRHQESLHHQIHRWKTPHGMSYITEGGGGEFAKQTEHWPTPGVHNSPDASPNSQRECDLRETVKNWPTPTVESGDQTVQNPTPKQTGGTTLGGEARSFPQAPATLTPGGESLSTTPASRRRLNPRFVSYLMGWPLIGGNGSDSLETESCLWRRRMRSQLLRLVSD